MPKKSRHTRKTVMKYYLDTWVPEMHYVFGNEDRKIKFKNKWYTLSFEDSLSHWVVMFGDFSILIWLSGDGIEYIEDENPIGLKAKYKNWTWNDIHELLEMILDEYSYQYL